MNINEKIKNAKINKSEVLSLDNTDLSELPKEVSNLTNLERLSLHNTKVKAWIKKEAKKRENKRKRITENRAKKLGFCIDGIDEFKEKYGFSKKKHISIGRLIQSEHIDNMLYSAYFVRLLLEKIA